MLAEGVVFLVLTLCNIREMIVGAIPYGVRMGISPAIGMMLLNIGIGKMSRHYILTYILAAIFLVKFFLVA